MKSSLWQGIGRYDGPLTSIYKKHKIDQMQHLKDRDLTIRFQWVAGCPDINIAFDTKRGEHVHLFMIIFTVWAPEMSLKTPCEASMFREPVNAMEFEVYSNFEAEAPGTTQITRQTGR